MSCGLCCSLRFSLAVYKTGTCLQWLPWSFSVLLYVGVFFRYLNAKKQQSCLCSRSRQSSCGGCRCFVIINFTFWLLRVVPSSPGVSVLCNHEVISRASKLKTGTSLLCVWGEDFCPFCCTCRCRKSYVYMAKATFSIYGSPYMCSHPSIFGKQMMAIQINLSVLYLFAERLKEFLGISSASWLFQLWNHNCFMGERIFSNSEHLVGLFAVR